jgi:type IX secretion system PorP/SprF family membrane protein
MKTKLIIIALLLQIGVVVHSSAQVDPHFSQYYAYPLWLNPALTGVINGDSRVAANYKNQWATINNAYETAAVSADFRATDKLSLGVNVLNQSAGGASYNYFSAYGSLGYGITLSDDGNQKLHFGLQAGVINRAFDMSKLQFGSQYNPEMGFDPNLPNLETLSNTSSTVFDANAGIFYYNGDPSSNLNAFGGFSAGHLSRPKDGLSGDGNSRIPIRWTAHGGVRIRASDYFDIVPNALYIKQQETTIKAFGAYSEVKFQDDKGLIFGALFRVKDAAVADVGYHVNNMIIGASYDFNTSSLNRATGGQGGIELSISYVFKRRMLQPEPICPRL